jgi:hypothetical protein
MPGMGFTGTILAVRSEESLTALDGVRELADHVAWHGIGAGGWQAVQLHRAPGWAIPLTGGNGEEALLTSLLASTGSPVFAGVVMHSDGAQLVGYSAAGRWSGWLRLEVLVDYLPYEYREVIDDYDEDDVPEDLDAFWAERYRLACEPLYEIAPRAEVAAGHAVTWAREAGLSPDPEAVLAVLDGYDVFAEGQVLRLLSALGVPDLVGQDPPQ